MAAGELRRSGLFIAQRTPTIPKPRRGDIASVVRQGSAKTLKLMCGRHVCCRSYGACFLRWRGRHKQVASPELWWRGPMPNQLAHPGPRPQPIRQRVEVLEEQLRVEGCGLIDRRRTRLQLVACRSDAPHADVGWLWNGITRSAKGYWDFPVALRFDPLPALVRFGFFVRARPLCCITASTRARSVSRKRRSCSALGRATR